MHNKIVIKDYFSFHLNSKGEAEEVVDDDGDDAMTTIKRHCGDDIQAFIFKYKK